jgi:hypothetical protein
MAIRAQSGEREVPLLDYTAPSMAVNVRDWKSLPNRWAAKWGIRVLLVPMKRSGRILAKDCARHPSFE